MILGFILSINEDFQGKTLQVLGWHRWFGVSTALISVSALVLGFQFFKRNNNRLRTGYHIALISSIILLAITGYFGSVMVHGEDYLSEAFAQSTNKSSSGASDSGQSKQKIDSVSYRVDFYEDIEPIFKRSCAKKCHSMEKKKGGLRLDKKKFAMRGGESGKVIVPGSSGKSLLYKRIALPKTHKDYMPSKGRPLSDEDVNMIKKWIDQGAIWPQR